jgi:hypothetical protein
MSNQEITAIRELFNEKMSGLTTIMNAHFMALSDRLDTMEKKYESESERIRQLEKQEITHESRCPQSKKIEIINKEIIDFKNHVTNTHDYDMKIRNLEDTQLTQKSIRKWIIGSVAITGTVVGILFALFKVFIES